MQPSPFLNIFQGKMIWLTYNFIFLCISGSFVRIWCKQYPKTEMSLAPSKASCCFPPTEFFNYPVGSLSRSILTFTVLIFNVFATYFSPTFCSSTTHIVNADLCADVSWVPCQTVKFSLVFHYHMCFLYSCKLSTI